MDVNKKIKIFNKPSVSITLKQIYIAVTVLLSVLFLILTVHVVMSFVTVGDVEIVGVYQPYDRTDIMQTTKLRSTDFWLAVDADEIEERLLKERKYLETVSVKKQFPNKIIISVESKTSRWYIDLAGTKYALDSDLRVIDETRSVDGVTKLVLPNISRVMAGDVPVFGQSETEVKETLKIIDTIRNSELKSILVEVDVSNRTDIRLKLKGDYSVRLGGGDSLEGKLAHINKMLSEESLGNGGTFYAESYASTGYVSFKPQ